MFSPEILYVLRTGRHEAPKGHVRRKLWRLELCCPRKNADEELRVIVSFDEANMLIITVIRLISEDEK